LARKETLVIDLSFYPSHEIINVFTGCDLQWCFDVLPICPKIFILWACTHDWTSFLSTKLNSKKIILILNFQCKNAQVLSKKDNVSK